MSYRRVIRTTINKQVFYVKAETHEDALIEMNRRRGTGQAYLMETKTESECADGGEWGPEHEWTAIYKLPKDETIRSRIVLAPNQELAENRAQWDLEYDANILQIIFGRVNPDI